MENKKYKLVCYCRIDVEDVEPMTKEEVEGEKEQSEFLFPENIYKIEEIE